ncbi:MAG: hypothetical protein IPF53_19735 [Blastocatellia bacterium]|nr:hypothetical protein [Blastocatellia bacterium]
MALRLLGLATLLALAPTATAQIEAVGKGSQSDLRGAASVFVDNKIRAELRDAIVTNLRTELPQLTIVERAEDASLVLRFSTTIGSDSMKLDRDRAGRADTGLSSTPAGPAPRERFPPSNRPDIVDSARNSTRTIDTLAPDDPDPRTYRYAIGSFLKPTGSSRFVETVSFKRRIGADTDRAVRDFVRKFAKAYRKANARTD